MKDAIHHVSMIKEAISKLVVREDLSEEEAKGAMEEIMNGEATEAQIASFLTALRMKGEEVDEIVSFARTMRVFCSRINPDVDGDLVDTCGTGGDKIKTFNISTISAFVAAGTGILVAKHGNRGIRCDTQRKPADQAAKRRRWPKKGHCPAKCSSGNRGRRKS
jgi:anthranilate phosphoribosyltransferase